MILVRNLPWYIGQFWGANVLLLNPAQRHPHHDQQKLSTNTTFPPYHKHSEYIRVFVSVVSAPDFMSETRLRLITIYNHIFNAYFEFDISLSSLNPWEYRYSWWTYSNYYELILHCFVVFCIAEPILLLAVF
jgi:hypothetical protein